jgi:hypothetical protein
MGPGFPANPWATPATATAPIPAAVSTLGFDVTADVRAFLDGSQRNFGWILKASGIEPDFPFVLDARESSQPPRLRLFTRCKPAFADCDHDPADGCEHDPIDAGTSCDDGDAW